MHFYYIQLISVGVEWGEKQQSIRQVLRARDRNSACSLMHKSTRMWWQSMNCTPKTTTATVTCHQLLQTSAKTTKSQQSDGKVECMLSPVKQPKFDFHQVTKSVTSSWGCSIGASIFTYTCFSSRIPVATTVFCEVLFGHLPALVSVLCSQLSTNRKTVHVSVCLYW